MPGILISGSSFTPYAFGKSILDNRWYDFSLTHWFFLYVSHGLILGPKLISSNEGWVHTICGLSLYKEQYASQQARLWIFFNCQIQYPSFPWLIAGATSNMVEMQLVVLVRAHAFSLHAFLSIFKKKGRCSCRNVWWYLLGKMLNNPVQWCQDFKKHLW